MKWLTDSTSGPSLHLLQYLESALPILKRYELRGMWPLHTCIRRLACLRMRSYWRCWNLEKGRVLSISLSRRSLGEESHADFHLRLRCARCSCLMADALAGRVFLSNGGRSVRQLAFPAASSLARLSTCSLPFTSLWLEIQYILSLVLVLFAAWEKAQTRYWPGDALGLTDVVISA